MHIIMQKHNVTFNINNFHYIIVNKQPQQAALIEAIYADRVEFFSIMIIFNSVHVAISYS